jgi:hypothetical protein
VELDPTDADNMSMDTQFMAVVVCTVGGATITDTPKGDVVRTNKFKLDHFAVVRDATLQNELYEALPALVGVFEEPDPELFVPNVDGNGEIIAVEGVAVEGSGGPGTFAVELVPEDDDDEDEEIFSPGARNPRMPAEPVPVGVPAPGSQPRQYDPALQEFLR